MSPTEGVEAPADSDPFDILAAVAGRKAQLGAALDAELASIELTAVAHATVPGYLHEALAACRDSGRTPAVIGRQVAEAVRTYLAKHGLIDQAASVITPDGYPPGHLQTIAYPGRRRDRSAGRYTEERRAAAGGRAVVAGRRHAGQRRLVRLLDATPVPCGQSAVTTRRSGLFGWAGYGYCPSHSRWYWGAKLMLMCTCEGTVTGFGLANPKMCGERGQARQMLEDQPASQPTGQPPAPPSSPTRAWPGRAPRSSSPAAAWNWS